MTREAVGAAAQLLGLRLAFNNATGRDDFSGISSVAYELFVQGEQQMSRPNNEGLEAAIEKFQAAVRDEPRFSAAYAGLAIAYGRRFAFNGGQANLTIAERNADLAIKYGPMSTRARFSQALMRLYSGDSKEAIRRFIELLKADPGNQEVLMYEARAFRDMNRSDVEGAIYQNLLQQRPNYWPAYNDLGLIYRSKGDYQKAINYFL